MVDLRGRVLIPFHAVSGRGGVSVIGTLTKTSASSPVTSDTVTLNVPGNSSGDVRFDNVSTLGSSPQYQKNGGSWTSITEDLVVNFANADTLAVRVTAIGTGTQLQFDLTDHGLTRLIQSVTLTKT